jgi:SAM-dependent methyltransferase
MHTNEHGSQNRSPSPWLKPGASGSHSVTVGKAKARLVDEEAEYLINLPVGIMQSRLAKYASGGRLENILDFGCGKVVSENALRKAFPDSAVHALDGFEENIQGARLPFPDETFDFIYMNGTMRHLPDIERQVVLKDLRRILKQGGFLFLHEHNPIRVVAQVSSAARAKTIAPEQARRLGQWSGFSVVESWYYAFFPHCLRFLRPIEKRLEWLPLGAQYSVWMVK